MCGWRAPQERRVVGVVHGPHPQHGARGDHVRSVAPEQQASGVALGAARHEGGVAAVKERPEQHGAHRERPQLHAQGGPGAGPEHPHRPGEPHRKAERRAPAARGEQQRPPEGEQGTGPHAGRPRPGAQHRQRQPRQRPQLHLVEVARMREQQACGGKQRRPGPRQVHRVRHHHEQLHEPHGHQHPQHNHPAGACGGLLHLTRQQQRRPDEQNRVGQLEQAVARQGRPQRRDEAEPPGAGQRPQRPPGEHRGQATAPRLPGGHQPQHRQQHHAPEPVLVVRLQTGQQARSRRDDDHQQHRDQGGHRAKRGDEGSQHGRPSAE